VRQRVGQVGFVQEDDGRDIGAPGGGERAAQRVVGIGRRGGQHDKELVYVGGQVFVVRVVRTDKHVAARQDGVNHAAVRAFGADVDEVADGGGSGFFASRVALAGGRAAGFNFARFDLAGFVCGCCLVDFNLIVPPMGGDDATGEATCGAYHAAASNWRIRATAGG